MQMLLTVLAAALPVAALVIALYRRSIYHHLRSDENVVVFNKCTSDLNARDILLVISLLVIETARNLVRRDSVDPVPKQKTRLQAQHGRRSSGTTVVAFPDVAVIMKLEVRPKSLGEYYTALGTSRDLLRSNPAPGNHDITQNNAHLVLFLSAISAPAILLLLARPKCPVRPLGGVNVRNYARLIKPDLCRQIIRQGLSGVEKNRRQQQASSWWTVRAAPLPEARRVNRGIEVDIRAVIVFHDRNATEKQIEIFEQVFTVLEFDKSRSSPRRSAEDAKVKSTRSNMAATSTLIDVPKRELKSVPRLASYFKIEVNDPRLWARLCKDYNPIHISSLAAKLFGFRSKIAHGNHVVAKSVDVLFQSGNDKFVHFCSRQDEQELWMQVEFQRPILLPTEVGVRSVEEGTTAISGRFNNQCAAFEVFREEKVHIAVAVGGQES